MKFINYIIGALGRENYKIDKHISWFSITIILFEKIIQLLRGLCIKFLFKKQNGLLFVGRRCTLKFKHLIKLGKSTNIGNNVIINALSKNGISIGNNVTIHDNTIIECTGVLNYLGVGLKIGNNVGIAQNCFIQVRGKVTIGNNVIFGPDVSIFSENHIIEDPYTPISKQGVVREDVFIEDGAWLGTKSTILSGVTVGKNSVVAAGSVVNKNVPPHTVVGGVPAKIIKQIKVG